MFEYEFKEAGTVNTDGFCKDFKEIKQEILKQTQECIHRRSIYPNEFIVEVEQYNDKIIIRTNWELSKNDDGSFNVIQP
ncbi:hypothetical protein [Terrisporobacter mayombei]|uniref:hypothetical protein n=1 Tax=Terrisporobacter mayombei TaxID=1541 RepID=UPI00265A4AF8|nr:hypothetical protein [Terrisporobacter mayombei]MCC3668637.1 hypothetical protein [Terrisporobacter mayombei]